MKTRLPETGSPSDQSLISQGFLTWNYRKPADSTASERRPILALSPGNFKMKLARVRQLKRRKKSNGPGFHEIDGAYRARYQRTALYPPIVRHYLPLIKQLRGLSQARRLGAVPSEIFLANSRKRAVGRVITSHAGIYGSTGDKARLFPGQPSEQISSIN